ncbi:Hypothetical Protein OBI_RACECAR_35 [Arthrobacter phage Racecar]|nr:hypothetical protein PBI_RACECAR_116 [Arthrobacter phage Racecar]QFG12791.1 hypothetical protein PBI_MIMI_113 [Arthrobacter phage Mimi]
MNLGVKMLRINMSAIEGAAQTVRQYNDVTVLVEEGQWQIIGEPKVLAEFEMTLAVELANKGFQHKLDMEDVRNEYVDLLDVRREGQSYLGEPTWFYDMEVIGDIKAHEIREL